MAVRTKRKDPRPARCLVFANRKGGCGKTTTAVNVSHALSRTGSRVLLVDMDPQAHATLSVGFKTDGACGDIRALLCGEASCHQAVAVTSIENLSLIPSVLALSAYEIENASRPGAETRLSQRVEPLALDFDFIIFDPPPTIGLLAVASMVAAREVYIPMQMHFLAMEGLAEMVRLIYRINATFNSRLCLRGIIPTFLNEKTRLAREIMDEIRTHFGLDTIFPGVRNNISLAEAPGYRQTIFQYAPESAGAQDYERVARRILDDPKSHPQEGGAES